VWAAPILAKEDLDKLAAQIDDCRTINGRLKLTVKNWTESMECLRMHDAMGMRWVPVPLLEMGQINHRPDFSSGQQKGVVIIGQSAASH
jgi:hypothetical protein